MRGWQNKPQVPCADCGRPCRGTRCRPCHLKATASVGRRRGLQADWGERKRRAAVVRAHREEYGDVCPGWGVPPHPASDLCADHVVAVRAGGAEGGPLTVLCRRCNSRKGAKVLDPRVATGGDRRW